MAVVTPVTVTVQAVVVPVRPVIVAPEVVVMSITRDGEAR
jgi:hypothetical protein